MTKRQVNIILGVLGAVVVVVVVMLAGVAWFATSAFHRQDADEAAASAAFDAARTRFKGATPVIELREGAPVLTRVVPASSDGSLRTMHVLHWSAQEGMLTTLDLPFALLRFRDSPVDIVRFVNVAGNSEPIRQRVTLRISDIERFGPALLLDQELEDGHRVLVWTE